MEREKLLAQLKAFQNYLKNYIEGAKSYPQTVADEKNEEYLNQLDAIEYELRNINSRYKSLRNYIQIEYPGIFTGLPYGMNENIRGVEHIQ
ncbi:MAG: hypothetical protein M3384_21965 [Acidobacteriota bacterium]|nr:hypothetical protein [Acidobacteriota bacterium]